jgi:hypothetical protein
MAFFKIVIIPNSAAILDNSSLRAQVIRRIKDEFNDVAHKSQNAKVKEGFSVEFVKESDPIASLAATDTKIPKTLFRVHLIAWKVRPDELLAKVLKVAPGFSAQSVVDQMKAEGGIGGRGPKGDNMAMVSTNKFEDGLRIDPKSNEWIEAGRQLGGLMAHELGHAMGIAKNGKGLMAPVFDVNVSEPNPISSAHFTADDTKIILKTLDEIANTPG